MEIQYLNHSSFLIKASIGAKKINILIDPFNDSIGIKFKKTEADILLLTHDHEDHSNVGGVLNLIQSDINNDSFEAFKDKPFLIKRAGEYEVKGVRVKGILSYHDDKNGSIRGENIIYIITVDGLRLCHLGDLGHLLTEKQLEEIGSVDCLIVPVGGEYTINAEQASEVISQIEPSYVIPMHFKTKSHSATYEKLGTLQDFLKEFGKEENTTSREKLTITKTSGEETQLVLLKPAYS